MLFNYSYGLRYTSTEVVLAFKALPPPIISLAPDSFQQFMESLHLWLVSYPSYQRELTYRRAPARYGVPAFNSLETGRVASERRPACNIHKGLLSLFVQPRIQKAHGGFA